MRSLLRIVLSALALLVFLPGPAVAWACPAPRGQNPFDLVADFVGKTWRGQEQGGSLVDVAAWEWALGKRAIRITHMAENSRLGPGPHGGETLILRDTGTGALVYHYFTLSGRRTQGRICVEDHGRLVMEEDVPDHPRFSKIRSTMTMSGNRMTSQAETYSNGTWSRISTMIYTSTDGVVLPKFPQPR